jgi:hypothetical protein
MPTRSATARVAGLVLTLALALAACTATPSDPHRDDVARVAAAVAALDGVVEVTDDLGPVEATSDEAMSDDPAARPWNELAVRTSTPDASTFAEVADAVADELAGVTRLTARVWQDTAADVPALAVQLTGSGDVARTRVVTDLAVVAGVTGVQVTPDAVSATTATAADLPALARATATLRTTSVLLSTADQRFSSAADPRVLDARVAALVADVDGRPGVTSQFLGDEGTGEAWLRVQVQGDDTVELLAAALAATPWPADAGVVHAVVASSFREHGVVVGRPEDPTTPAPEPSAPDSADDPTAPSCPGDALDVADAGDDAALGRRYLLLTATNVSDAACAVEGRPEVGFRRASGTPVPDVETGTPSGTPAPARVVVPPGGVVHAELTWRAMSTSQDPDVTVALLVTAVPGADPVTLDTREGGLDVLAGAAVEIGAWEPGAGWSDAQP